MGSTRNEPPTAGRSNIALRIADLTWNYSNRPPLAGLCDTKRGFEKMRRQMSLSLQENQSRGASALRTRGRLIDQSAISTQPKIHKSNRNQPLKQSSRKSV